MNQSLLLHESSTTNSYHRFEYNDATISVERIVAITWDLLTENSGNHIVTEPRVGPRDFPAVSTE